MVADDIAFESMRVWNDRFVSDAIREWDLRGEGKFANFINSYVADRWIEMVVNN